MGDNRGDAYGRYIRAKRVEAGMSLRDVADQMGISHTYLAEVERGKRGPFKTVTETQLIRVIPGLQPEDLARLRVQAAGVQLRLADAPPKYQDLGLVLARRIHERNISDRTFSRLFELLGRDEDEGDP